MRFWSKKPTKNPSKTTSEPFKNRGRKRVVSQHRFFKVSASILEPLGPPTWSQVGHFGLKTRRRLPVWTVLQPTSFKNSVLEASGLDFGGPGAQFWRVLGQYFRDFWSPDWPQIRFYFRCAFAVRGWVCLVAFFFGR